MLTLSELNALSQAIDTSWGSTSTPQTASYSVKISLMGNEKLHVKYMAVVNFASQPELIRTKKAYNEEAERVISAVLKNVKEKYKDLTQKSLKLKEDSSSNDLEVINLAVHNPKRTAYYRVNTIYTIN